MSRRAMLIALLLPFMAVQSSPASAPVHSGAQATTHAADSVEQVRLGQSVIPLSGPWKFQTGDNPAWSQPDFDDSSWALMDMTARSRSSDPSRMIPLPGWTARGYPHYAGYAWYRLQVDVQGSGRSLALKMPDSVDDAYQVFINGVRIGQFGKFTGHSVTAYGAIPQAFPLPKDLTGGKMTIAIRLWMDSATPFLSPDAGGLHDPPMLGYLPNITDMVRLGFNNNLHTVGTGFLEWLILFMAMIMALALYWLEPDEEAYLWLAIVCIVTLVGNSVVLLANFTLVGQTQGVILRTVIAAPARIGLWVMFWAYWFRLPKIRRLHWATWVLVGLLTLGTAMMSPPLYGHSIPVQAANILYPACLILKLGLGVMLAVVAIMGFMRHRGEGGAAGVAILLAFIANFQRELQMVHVPILTTILSFRVSLGQISTILSLLIITVLLLRRFVHSQRQQEQWKLEIEQARSVQHLLIPDQLPRVHNMLIRSEYHPHREVGGDFFQILPLDDSGSALVMLGDVTGKGLQAGMLVALIVGAIRSAVQQTTDPAQILSMINDQLAEREHSSATCVILRISDDGAVRLAHAGHLPPYLNARELPMEGALPLGMVPGIEFPSQSLQLHAGDELTLMSDGVVEAQDSSGRLFGFDRVHDMMSHQATAGDLVAAAKKFGQADDITVLQVQWQGQSSSLSFSAEPQLAAH
ncbi:MAG TPA: SpoIIE family protein phosphatase [Candidatus Aquilonibacter sp.]|nr:SpoIIE family protein phosphatase [Candidatus Aquilonibacter sp.]